MANKQPFITLTELQRMVGNTIRQNPALQGVWVVAELADVRQSGGHCYMELIEKDEGGTTRAKLRAMIWSNTYLVLRRRFHNETGREISSGMKVLLRGTANHHELYGLSFTIQDIDTSYTLGDMERLRREILSKLEKEGVLGRNRALKFPAMPQRIAVISAPGAAGYGDFMNQLTGNPEGFIFYPYLFNAVMQGDRTVPTVLEALDIVEETASFWDCVVIIRGGGATSDLNAFDNYELAHRIATFKLPVVVGIGHERDRTVLDEIACVRCKTPTAVAAFLHDRLEESWTNICQAGRRIVEFAEEALKGERMRLSQVEMGLPARVSNRTIRTRMDLQRKASTIAQKLAQKTPQEKGRLIALVSRIENSVNNRLRDAGHAQERLTSMVRVLNPYNTLKRGYSITRVNGHAVTDISAIKAGNAIETTLLGGKVVSEVKKVNKS